MVSLATVEVGRLNYQPERGEFHLVQAHKVVYSH